ncbi:hypothetical protein HZY91_09810 [Facklamia sp. DSM 111018]|uniref:Uncharacterized protein n=1 Tax=Facklamia lactis TaxID=2749967 RepID=A0ABS0LSX1_9LACT|nr:hypothetical protein [Facklamia lactis]MBG9981362.1 hypothetical protein [Facklamia lactis]MBG9987162.1 hypothetical protein [Facklamia lactis]
MNTYKVTANVKSEKYGQGQLVAELTHEDFVTYANLSDQKKLNFLKNKGASFQIDVDQLSDEEVSDYQVQTEDSRMTSSISNPSRGLTRKMRVNINGQDTGWLDVTEENEAQYNQLVEQFNEMHQQFNERFNRIFSQGPGSLLGFPNTFSLLEGNSKNKQMKEENQILQK